MGPTVKLHDNWRLLLRKSWAVRWALLAGFFSGAEIILPFFVDDMPRLLFAGLSMVCAMVVPLARVLAQPKDGL